MGHANHAPCQLAEPWHKAMHKTMGVSGSVHVDLCTCPHTAVVLIRAQTRRPILTSRVLQMCAVLHTARLLVRALTARSNSNPLTSPVLVPCERSYRPHACSVPHSFLHTFARQQCIVTCWPCWRTQSQARVLLPLSPP